MLPKNKGKGKAKLTDNDSSQTPQQHSSLYFDHTNEYLSSEQEDEWNQAEKLVLELLKKRPEFHNQDIQNELLIHHGVQPNLTRKILNQYRPPEDEEPLFTIEEMIAQQNEFKERKQQNPDQFWTNNYNSTSPTTFSKNSMKEAKIALKAIQDQFPGEILNPAALLHELTTNYNIPQNNAESVVDKYQLEQVLALSINDGAGPSSSYT